MISSDPSPSSRRAIDRRTVLIGSMALAAGSTVPAVGKTKSRSLVPDSTAKVLSYWCTWGVQNHAYYKSLPIVTRQNFTGSAANAQIEAQLNEANLFGQRGWVHTILPQIRSDLNLLIDEGWQTGGYASTKIDQTKFPSFDGNSVANATKLAGRIRAAGWHGAGLWCRNPPPGNEGSEFVSMMKNAGISYCKVDQGDPALDFVRLRNEFKADLVLEHAIIDGPFNGDWRENGRFRIDEYVPVYFESPGGVSRRTILRGTDVYRVYDVSARLSLPTTIDRLAQYLAAATAKPQTAALVNVEDEVYLAAVMGCTMGIMRHPYANDRVDGAEDWFLNGPRQVRRRMDEVVRALRWQRIAPPFRASEGFVRVDREILGDAWHFSGLQTWLPTAFDQLVQQGAPARLTRNLELPDVVSTGLKPFVFATRFPNGAIAIGCQERTLPDRPWFMPLSKVAVSIGSGRGPIGIFGKFHELTLVLDGPLGPGPILAQDLADDLAIDIRSLIRIEGNQVSLPGNIIEWIGLKRATPGDLSSPALVLQLPAPRALKG